MTAMTRPGQIDHIQIVILDETIQVYINKAESR